MATQAQVTARLQAFDEACGRAGIRVTPQRRAIFHAVAAVDDHPSVETIRDRLRATMPNLSLDTVYRTLALFEDLGLLRRVGIACDRARFDANTERHHHFVCTACGRIEDVIDPRLNRIKPPEAAAAFGAIDSMQVEMRGVCHQCAAAQATGGGGRGGKRARGAGPR